MTKMNSAAIEQYQDLLRKDPNSLAFAALSESYREMGLLEQAEKVARDGIQRHPKYTGGFLSLARVLFDRKNYADAVVLFQKVTELDPQNLLGFWFQGQCHLVLGNPKQALKCFKYVLFINPLHSKAQKAIEKLESLTADEYEEDVFQMQPLAATSLSNNNSDKELRQEVAKRLSLVDAYLVRNDFTKARETLLSAEKQFPNNAELASRWELFDESSFEMPEKLQPNKLREKEIIDLKIKKLENLLLTLKS